MSKTVLTIEHEVGLHARPLALFVKTVNDYDAEIQVINITREKGPVNGASMVKLLLLAVGSGHQIEIDTSGNQADELLAALIDLVESNFGEN